MLNLAAVQISFSRSCEPKARVAQKFPISQNHVAQTFQIEISEIFHIYRYGLQRQCM